MRKLEIILMGQRDAFELWKIAKNTTSAVRMRLYHVAFPLGSDDPLYLRWVKEIEKD